MSVDGKIELVPGVVAQIQSRSLPSLTHDIRLAKGGLVYCDCEGFRWRGHCAHIDTLIEQKPTAVLMVKAGLREKIAHLEAVIKSLDE